MRITKFRRIHLLGASGAGTSTLGRAIATRMGHSFLETDSFYWLETQPPFRQAREASQRRSLLRTVVERSSRWVLAGSLCGWGDTFMPLFDLVIFVETPDAVRRSRLLEREQARYGTARLSPGGDLHEQHEALLAWASAYDSGSLQIRSRRLHEDWLRQLPAQCQVLRVDGRLPVAKLVNALATTLPVLSCSSA